MASGNDEDKMMAAAMQSEPPVVDPDDPDQLAEYEESLPKKVQKDEKAYDKSGGAPGADKNKPSKKSDQTLLPKREEEELDLIVSQSKQYLKWREDLDNEKRKAVQEMISNVIRVPYKQNVEDPSNPIPEPLNRLEQLDMARMLMMHDSPTLTIFGARGTGKTFLARNLMYLMRKKYPFGMVMSATAYNGFWQKLVPGWWVIQGFNQLALAAFLRHQRVVVEAKQKGHLPPDTNTHVFLILDDIVHDERFRFNEELNEIYVAGRHADVTIVTLSQKVKGVNTTWRSNSDICVVMFQYRGPEIDTLWEEFGLTLAKKDFRKMLFLSTTDHNALVVHNQEKTGIIRFRYHTFKAIDPGPFILGCKEFWEPPKKQEWFTNRPTTSGKLS